MAEEPSASGAVLSGAFGWPELRSWWSDGDREVPVLTGVNDTAILA